jgi:hypothetical protein
MIDQFSTTIAIEEASKNEEEITST